MDEYITKNSQKHPNFGLIHRVSEIPPTVTINIGQKGGLIGHASVTQTPTTLNFGLICIKNSINIRHMDGYIIKYSQNQYMWPMNKPNTHACISKLGQCHTKILSI